MTRIFSSNRHFCLCTMGDFHSLRRGTFPFHGGGGSSEGLTKRLKKRTENRVMEMEMKMINSLTFDVCSNHPQEERSSSSLASN